MIGYVLSGGGALGSFEVGVLRQLEDKGIRPDIVIGTSTGALNAIGYSFKGIEYLESLWNGIKSINDVFKSRGILAPFFMLFGNGKGLNDAKPLEDKIRKTIDRWPHVKVGVCRVSLKTTAAEYVYANTNGVGLESGPEKMVKATLASASTPIFNDVVDNEFVDGGLRHIAPLGEAIKRGCDEIYVILCEQFQENQNYNYEGNVGNVLKVAGYSINTLIQGVLWNDVMFCQKINSLLEGQTKLGLKPIKLHVYAPTKDIGDATDFSPKHIQTLMIYGKTIAPVI